MIALNADVAFLGQSVVGVLRELARRDLGLPVGTAEVIFDDFLAVQPMLDMIAIDDDARLVPLAKRLDHACGRTIQAVRRPRRGEPAAAIGRVGGIQQLILRAAPVNVVVFARRAIEDAAVALLADFPVNLELEIAELLLGHQVIDRAFLGERAVNDVPALRHALRAPAAKGVEHFSVEQRVPLCRGLCFRRSSLRARRATRPPSNHAPASSAAFPTIRPSIMLISTLRGQPQEQMNRGQAAENPTSCPVRRSYKRPSAAILPPVHPRRSTAALPCRGMPARNAGLRFHSRRRRPRSPPPASIQSPRFAFRPDPRRSRRGLRAKKTDSARYPAYSRTSNIPDPRAPPTSAAPRPRSSTRSRLRRSRSGPRGSQTRCSRWRSLRTAASCSRPPGHIKLRASRGRDPSTISGWRCGR